MLQAGLTDGAAKCVRSESWGVQRECRWLAVIVFRELQEMSGQGEARGVAARGEGGVDDGRSSSRMPDDACQRAAPPRGTAAGFLPRPFCGNR